MTATTPSTALATIQPELHRHRAARALNEMRVSEATGADIEQLGLERGHRTLVITRKGGNVVTISLAPRTARAIELAVGERAEGPPFLAGDGRRLDRHATCTVAAFIAGQPDSPHRSICLAHLSGQADGQADLSLGAQWERSLTATTTAIANRRSGRFGKEAQLIRPTVHKWIICAT
jgi:hypothetical protein